MYKSKCFIEQVLLTMLVYVNQDIFKSPAQVLVNTVNTVGVMGKGIAKRYKEVYPEMYNQYRDLCENNLLQIGKLWLYKTDTKWVLNFPTKKHWRNPSKLEYIESGLQKFVSTYEEKKITSISFPQLGVGNGGLDWEKQVKPLKVSEHDLREACLPFSFLFESQPNNLLIGNC